MSHHHKSNTTVEGNPETGHGRGLPRRPDDRELEQRTDLDRVEAGLPAKEAPPRRGRAAVVEAERS
jgi:hypothetical protein